MEFKVYCSMDGTSFSPRAAEQATGLTLNHKSEPGEPIDWGRLKGKGVLAETGRASLDPPDDLRWQERLPWLLDTLTKHLLVLRKCGVEEMVIYLGVFYGNQCNFEFTPEEMRKIADLGVTFAISCYELDELKE